MGRALDAISDELAVFIARQHVFFVATAPSDGGHVNLSPKGLDTFAVLDPDTIAYLDLTGSGVETIAHLRDNGRITIMFCAFDGPPQILRLQGEGVYLPAGSAGFDELVAGFDAGPGARGIVRVDVTRLSSSCGYSVPFMDFREERPTLQQWAARKTDEELDAYHEAKNRVSIDGLPWLGSAPATPLP